MRLLKIYSSSKWSSKTSPFPHRAHRLILEHLYLLQWTIHLLYQHDRRIPLLHGPIKSPENIPATQTFASALLPSIEPSIESVRSNTVEKSWRSWRYALEADRTIVLRLCYQFKDKYGHISTRQFGKVAMAFTETTGRPISANFYRAIPAWMTARRDYWLAFELGDEDTPTPDTEALDAWIPIVDGLADANEPRVEAGVRTKQKTREYEQWRSGALARFTERRPRLLRKKQTSSG